MSYRPMRAGIGRDCAERSRAALSAILEGYAGPPLGQEASRSAAVAPARRMSEKGSVTATGRRHVKGNMFGPPRSTRVTHPPTWCRPSPCRRSPSTSCRWSHTSPLHRPLRCMLWKDTHNREPRRTKLARGRTATRSRSRVCRHRCRLARSRRPSGPLVRSRQLPERRRRCRQSNPTPSRQRQSSRRARNASVAEARFEAYTTEAIGAPNGRPRFARVQSVG